MSSTAPTSPLGSMTGNAYDSWFRQITEYVPDLIWPLSIDTYSRMRRDPTATSILAAYTLPIRRAQWSVDPAGSTPDLAQVVADSLGLPMLGKDEPTPEARRGVQWPDHLRTALLALVFGHYAFEPFYAYRDGRVYLAGLPERQPSSISDIKVTPAGDLDRIRQWNPTGGKPIEIPADRLLWYVHDREGAEWEGNSLLRSAFGPWLIKREMWRVEATKHDRFAVGTPVAMPLPGTSPTQAQLIEAGQMAQQFRGGATSGGALPPGFTLAIKGMEGQVTDVLLWIRYLDEQMARSTLSSVLDLSSSPNGSRALGTTFVDLLAMAQQAIADQHAQMGCQLAEQIAGFNDAAATAPRVVVGDVTVSKRTLAQSVADLVAKGGLTLDRKLESWVRDALNLPEQERSKPVPAPLAQQTAVPLPADGQAPADGQPPAPGQPPTPPPVVAASTPSSSARVTTEPARRALTTIEAAAGIDPAQMDADATAAETAVLMAWLDITTAQRGELRDGIESALGSGDLSSLLDVTVDTTAAVMVLAAAMGAAHTAGVRQATKEAQKQGAAVGDLPEHPGYEHVAKAVAGTMAAAMTAAAAREALRLWGPGADPASVAALVVDHLAGLGDRYPSDVIGGAVNGAMNGGRATAMAAAPRARYFASEVRDANTCDACAAIDGHEYPSLGAAEADYPTGGYALCLGRERCRGIIFAEYEDLGGML